jgi:hypothetical protein
LRPEASRSGDGTPSGSGTRRMDVIVGVVVDSRNSRGTAREISVSGLEEDTRQQSPESQVPSLDANRSALNRISCLYGFGRCHEQILRPAGCRKHGDDVETPTSRSCLLQRGNLGSVPTHMAPEGFPADRKLLVVRSLLLKLGTLRQQSTGFEAISGNAERSLSKCSDAKCVAAPFSQ